MAITPAITPWRGWGGPNSFVGCSCQWWQPQQWPLAIPSPAHAHPALHRCKTQIPVLSLTAKRLQPPLHFTWTAVARALNMATTAGPPVAKTPLLSLRSLCLCYLELLWSPSWPPTLPVTPLGRTCSSVRTPTQLTWMAWRLCTQNIGAKETIMPDKAPETYFSHSFFHSCSLPSSIPSFIHPTNSCCMSTLRWARI